LVLQNQQQQQQQNQSQSQQQNQNENIQSDSTPSVIELQDLVLSDKEKRMAINNKYLNSLLATSKKEKQDLQEQVCDFIFSFFSFFFSCPFFAMFIFFFRWKNLMAKSEL